MSTEPVAAGLRVEDVGLSGRQLWAIARLLGGALVLGLLVHRFGAAPFRAAVDTLDVRLVLAALLLTAVTTACCAQRWRVVAAELGRGPGPRPGTGPTLSQAIRAYYRSQFLNVTLPGGVAGDAERAWRHGLRAVFWERTSGQVVQLVLALLVLTAVPSPFRPWALAGAGAAVVAVAGLYLWRRSRVRPAVLAPRVWPVVLVVSAVAVAGHLTLFVISARATGVEVGWHTVVPLALLVLVASAIPFNVAGWGPREGTAAWAFGAAGVGTAAGLTTAVLYGALVLLATLPGAVLLLLDTLRPAAP